ncbi:MULTISPECIES: hypothetical protein [Thermoactinomyces]|jgi:hypothetical protein|uniref:DUF4304 domain-containing protein n=1 Tax=Thermoactinomyces vulgaris TaxID=2026 RepID=A0ABS0QGJ2_THEVU|nr:MULTISPECIES: hypothetical protein [Thermoactinomyces]KYQ86409.1 hypothetical protein AYX07_10310 [Thermoactinomyces sp. AS95]MBA4551894.1 hypothetical protein [Thermoactinomyces vulgaris]MBA4597225.1 hypothetical protein [Thermoactinomyces vulgaris]MBH8586461.1 hypothetical protein [Thermoactinomyces sp. CICC 10520]MBH8588367.1 hypothetical protein [Thermoactinomyces vulgaris]
MDCKIKLLIQEAIDEKKDEVIQHFQELFQYPFHPDATFILLEVRGDGGIFGVSVTPMNGWGKQLPIDVYGGDSELGFGFDAFTKIRQELPPEEFEKMVEDDELVGDMDDYVKEYLLPFFKECFDQAGGKRSTLPYYLFYPYSGDACDLVNEVWTYPD